MFTRTALAPARIGLTAAVVGLLVGPTALVLGLHRHPARSPDGPALVPSTGSVVSDPPAEVTWTTTPAALPAGDLPASPEAPPGLVVESIATAVPALTHAAFRSAPVTD